MDVRAAERIDADSFERPDMRLTPYAVERILTMKGTGTWQRNRRDYEFGNSTNRKQFAKRVERVSCRPRVLRNCEESSGLHSWMRRLRRR